MNSTHTHPTPIGPLEALRGLELAKTGVRLGALLDIRLSEGHAWGRIRPVPLDNLYQRIRRGIAESERRAEKRRPPSEEDVRLRETLCNLPLADTDVKVGHIISVAIRDGIVSAFARLGTINRLYTAIKADVGHPFRAVQRLYDRYGGRLDEAPYEGPHSCPFPPDGDYADADERDALEALRALPVGDTGLLAADIVGLRVAGGKVHGSAKQDSIESIVELIRSGDLGRIEQ